MPGESFRFGGQPDNGLRVEQKHLLEFPVLERSGGAFNVAHDLDHTSQGAEDILGRPGWNEFDNRLALLGDEDGFPLLLDFVHDPKALGLELGGGHCLHVLLQVTIVI
jgi:hypothetical protein